MKHAVFYTFTIVTWLVAPAAIAASDPFGMEGKHNNKAPIEINADQLDVFQEENKAIFSGHVVAIQGDVRLKSEKMTVYYRKHEGEADKKEVTPGQNGIKKIDVEGDVFLTTPQETARGTTGVYDVENHRIMLDNNVVLTREKNTLKGDHLVYDFATGKSALTSSGKTVGSTGRVRALFIPEDNKEQKP
jgi:lipopolysaccharide export system protein LptA